MSERGLPTVGGSSPSPGAGGAGAAASAAGTAAGPPGEAGSGGDAQSPSPPPARARPASSGRLVATLALAGAVAGFFIVLVHLWSEPRIQAYQAQVLSQAVGEVLSGPAETRVFFLHEGELTPSPPEASDTASLDRVWVGFDGGGGVVGVAAAAAEPGFQDVIRLIFGYHPGEARVLGMKVLESRETPGLGDKIEKDSAFVAQFAGAAAPLEGVKPGKGTGAAHEVDMITGATISAQAVVDIINNRVADLEGPMRRLWATGVREPSPAPSPVPTGGGS